MPVTIDATVSGASANSYCDLATALVYLNNRLNAAVFTAEPSADQQSRALIEASTELTMLEGAWEGQRALSLQSLSWPRQFAIDHDKPQIIGVMDISQLYFPVTTIPSRIVAATAELALEFLRAGTTDIAGADKTLNVVQKDIDVIHTFYAKPWERAQGLARFPRVIKLIAPLLDASQSGGLKMVRV